MFLLDRYRHLRFRLADLNCLGYMALLNLLLPSLRWESSQLVARFFDSSLSV